MSKYQSLWNYIKESKKDIIELSFDEIEKILSFKIDHSILNYKKELLNYGYEVNKISLKDKMIFINKR